MLDNEFYISREAKASLVSIVCPSFEEHATEKETLRSLGELRELMRTLGIETGDQYIQNKKAIDPASILGSGKILEIAEQAREEGSSLLVFDCELTSSQIRNIKKLTGLSVVDRCHIILEIFSEHAHTNEAKIQIEIARLQYILPRLAGFWSHLGRQKGGIGVRGGEGEQQIELDRRIIRERIEFFKRELKEVEKSRVEQRKRRSKKAITAALVGYTNAGKSSLMNRLCRVNVLEEDKLFATLDSTFRMLNPDTKPPMILIDTVGFLSNLPNTLIDGFKTTLESALEADLLIIVCDISDEHYEKQLKVTMNVLNELGLEGKEKLIVFNKSDKLNDPIKASIIKRTYPESFVISSFDPEQIKDLRSHIVNYFLEKQNRYDLFVPYDAGAAHSQVVSKTNVIKTANFERGIFYRVRAPDFIFEPLALHQFLIGPDDPLISEFNSL
ncbi:GTPase HflX [Bacteriovorax sp. Seq25_V]|uniref:GTPase HflX n=1 Tax=Bacteriovorax sp. Seq25_V TaxID=1201288 RepID=UPI00038A4A14|nr:GTPase HflX [Bacteriovorax sp. Seq25_V]EQC47588.1 GTP-binding protein HflX [Bacteriovorax sp. Seq25_V]